MSLNYGKHFAQAGPTSQLDPIPGRKDQVKNNAGGYVFQIGDWDRLDRFLILGSEGNTYYCSERKMTIDNAQCVLRCLEEDGQRVVNRIVEISDAGRAPTNDPALFALALASASKDVKTRAAAFNALPKVARIGTHLFHFVEFMTKQRGWSRMSRRAIANWYLNQPIERLVNQVAKYQQRDGWSNIDLLRLSHPITNTPVRKAIFDWVCGRDNDLIPPMLKAMDSLKKDANVKMAVEAIENFELPRECLPTELLNEKKVWEALLVNMPMTAMVRNLGKMTAIGVLKPLGRQHTQVVDKLLDAETIRKARLHPMAVLLALKTYQSGHGDKGKLSWDPVRQVVDALDDAFYLAFQNAVPTGKNILIGLDVSGSMSMPLNGTTLKVCEAAAAIAMTVARTEKNYHILAFNHGLSKLNITAKSQMSDVLKQTEDVNFGGTDCALPMLHALDKGLDVDAFVVITDNETHSGRRGHPVQALKNYRKMSGRNAKLVVCGMTATEFSIADPNDPGMLDIVGFDAALPNILMDFIRN